MFLPHPRVPPAALAIALGQATGTAFAVSGYVPAMLLLTLVALKLAPQTSERSLRADSRVVSGATH